MNLLAVLSTAIARRSLLYPWMATALAASLVLPTASGHAQTSLSHTEDAAPIPRGMVRVRVITGWTRFDERFTTTGRTSIDADLSADPLGSVQLPRLAPLDVAAQTLAGDSQMRISLGRLVTRSDARIVTTPIALEYGLTRRLSVGLLVPVVQTRRVIQIDVNSKTGAPANVGYLLTSQRSTAAAQNLAAVTSLNQAASALTALIARCQATPTAPGCTAYNADASGASAALTLANSFATAAAVWGTKSDSTILAPRALGSLAVEIELQRNALNQRLLQFLGAGAATVQPLFFANADFAYLDLQGGSGVPGLLQSTLGGGLDSIQTTERLGFGDIEVGAQYLLLDQFQRDSLPRRGLQSRLMVGGSVRFPTSRPDSAQNLVGIPTGEGAGVELRSALDMVKGRFGGTVAARYVKHFARTVTAPLAGDPNLPGWPFPVFGPRKRTAGDVMALDVTPRFLFGEWMALQAHYGLERMGAATWDAGADPTVLATACPGCLIPTTGPSTATLTAQRLGLGVRYSTVDAYSRGQARYPVEISFTHLETTSGSAELPKLTRDQIQLRVYVRVLGR